MHTGRLEDKHRGTMSEEIAARAEENEAIKSFIAHRDAGTLKQTRVVCSLGVPHSGLLARKAPRMPR